MVPFFELPTDLLHTYSPYVGMEVCGRATGMAIDNVLCCAKENLLIPISTSARAPSTSTNIAEVMPAATTGCMLALGWKKREKNARTSCDYIRRYARPRRGKLRTSANQGVAREPESLGVLHLGDSRQYALRPDTGRMFADCTVRPGKLPHLHGSVREDLVV